VEKELLGGARIDEEPMPFSNGRLLERSRWGKPKSNPFGLCLHVVSSIEGELSVLGSEYFLCSEEGICWE
jgi:hypothetical protein